MDPTTLTITILGFLAFLLIIKEAAIGFMAWRRFRAARYARRCEVTQRHFGEARNVLMRAVVAGDLSPDTYLFRVLYFINTAFIRRPDEYPALSAQIRNITTWESTTGLGDKMAQEAGAISIQGKRAIEATVQALDHIVIDYSFLWRSISRVLRRSDPHFSIMVFMMMIRETKKKEQYKADIQETKRQLHRLAMA